MARKRRHGLRLTEPRQRVWQRAHWPFSSSGAQGDTPCPSDPSSMSAQKGCSQAAELLFSMNLWVLTTSQPQTGGSIYQHRSSCLPLSSESM